MMQMAASSVYRCESCQ